MPTYCDIYNRSATRFILSELLSSIAIAVIEALSTLNAFSG
jgi:hypothetical protein